MGESSEDELSPQAELDASDAAAIRSIAENSPDNIMLLDREARIRYINWTVPDLTREAVYGIHAYDFVPAEFREGLRQCYARVVETGRADRFEVSYISEDGDISLWESRIAPVMRGGKVTGFAVISSNVSERRLAAADRDRFFNLSLDMLCVAGDGYFKRLNPAWRRTLGYGEEELQSRPFLDFVHPEDRASTAAKVSELEAGSHVTDFENRYLCKDGSYRWLSWRAAWDPARRVIHAIARDVTEQRQLEAQLHQSQKMDAIGQLAAGIAHDFNNLILVIGANVELAAGTADSARRTEHLNEVSKAANRASDMTRQLLAFGRHPLMRSAAVDVGALANDLLRMVRPLLHADVRLQFELASGLPAVEGDPGQLEQVILNLCLNARDAMPNGGKLLLRVDTVDASSVAQLGPRATHVARYVRIAVEDDGVGMTAQVRERIFEPFFTTKSTGKGTGLGLSTAYGIVQGHGGFMRVHSELGRGSVIEVYLPATSAPSAAPFDPAEDAAAGHASGETVLVAEDVEGVREVVVSILEGAGYRVLTAPDGELAVSVFREHQAEIDLVLLDVVMPRLSGPEAFAEMRVIKPNLRAVFTSGYTDAANFRAVRLTGAPFVAKPYEPASLLRILRRVLATRG